MRAAQICAARTVLFSYSISFISANLSILFYGMFCAFIFAESLSRREVNAVAVLFAAKCTPIISTTETPPSAPVSVHTMALYSPLPSKTVTVSGSSSDEASNLK